MPKPQPPPHAVDAKTDLREASRAAREARKKWTAIREAYKANGARVSYGDVIALTLSMWTAERELEISAEWWRKILAERAAMPVAERWDLAALERWAVAQDKAGAP